MLFFFFFMTSVRRSFVPIWLSFPAALIGNKRVPFMFQNVEHLAVECS